MISICLAKTTGVVTANTATTAYQIFTGTPGTEATGGWATVPEAISRYTLGTDTWCMLLRVNNSWELVPFTNHASNVTLSGTIADGATGSVTLSNGRTVTGTNRSGASLSAGNAVAIYDMVDDEWMLVGGGSGGGTGDANAWAGFTIDDIAPGATATVELSNGGTQVEAVNHSDFVYLEGANHERILVFQDTLDSGYKAIKAGTGIELYEGTLTSTLASGTSVAAVSTLSAWSNGHTVSPGNVDNDFGLAGVTDDGVLVGRRTSSGSAEYVLIQVLHKQEVVLTEVLPDSATNTTKLQEKHRTLAVMSSGTESSATDWVSLVEDTFVIDVLPDSGTATTALQQKTLAIRRFPTTNSDSAATAWLTLEAQQTVTDVEDTGSALTRDVLTIYVMPNTGTPSAGTVSSFTTCP